MEKDASAYTFVALDQSMATISGKSLRAGEVSLSPLESANLKLSLTYGLISLLSLNKKIIFRVKEYAESIQEIKSSKGAVVRIGDPAASRMRQFEINKNIVTLTGDAPVAKERDTKQPVL
jgi:hypothetical protein